MKKLILAIACIIAINFNVSAQVALAIGFDEDDSAEEYQVFTGKHAYSNAKDWIKNHNHARKTIRESGLSLSEGIYVIVRASYVLSDGKRRTSYGVGTSKNSTTEATENAVDNLETYDALWKKSYGYDTIAGDKFDSEE